MEPLPGESDSPSVTAKNPLEIRSDLADGGESTFASIFSTIRPTERDQLGYNQDKALEENTFQGCNKMESFAAEGSLLSGAKQLVERFEYEESLQIRRSTSKESISHSSSVEDFVDEVLNEARSCKADSNRPASVSDLEVMGAEAGLDGILDSGCNERIISTIEDRELKKSANKISKYSLSDTSKDFFAGNTARARVMPKRQGTLTENNPFRCTTRIENSEAPERSPINEEELAIEDEKTTLATVALFSRSVTDEDEEVVVGEEEGEEQTDAFNPFQTIYPASEKESSEEEEEEGDEVEDEESTKLGFPQVEIKPEKPVENGTEKTKCMVPLLPAPPKPTTPAYQQDEKESNLHEFELPASGDKTLKDFVLKNKTPSGWETFFETATSPQTQATVDIAESELVKAFEVDWSEPPPVDSSNLHEFELPASGDKTLKDLVLKNKTPSGWETFFETATSPQTQATVDIAESELVKAFEVDWSEPPPVDSKTAPVPVVPEPPRPETPDPALEEPFAPSFPLNHVWRLWLRFPEKKKKVKQLSKYTSDRTWKEVAVTLTEDRGRYEINLHEIDSETGTHNAQPFRTLRTEPYMQLSRCKLQQYDKYGKLNIFKVNHVTYRELPGMRPEKFSLKTLQQLVSHKPKQNVALDHLPIYSEILKFGSLDQTMMRGLMSTLEDALMRIPSHKDEGLSYSHEEICCYVIDEYVGEVSESGTIREQKARTRIFCSAFVNKGPHIVLGINDKWRFGREIVRRSDILPVMHDEWITIWKPEFHSCLEMEDYEKDHMLKFYPLDGCKFELMRFRVSLRNNRELPLQLHCAYSIDDRRVSMRCELLVPGYFTASQRSGAVPCEDVEIRIPVPEEWIYHFRVEKHNRYGSVHSTLRKPGKIKGLERITQMAQSLLPPSLLEASIGLAKYEHIYKSVVWRIPRVPEKNEGE
ncbi:unnamed protein product [Schistocephalus solidus]|uniref:Reticulon n=1 Tax=Schistocephalus solidus TaxID=70667 RepID=A0A183TU52_SCHSO|nr:unnamed protein product [Schistocephalus solidus]